MGSEKPSFDYNHFDKGKYMKKNPVSGLIHLRPLNTFISGVSYVYS